LRPQEQEHCSCWFPPILFCPVPFTAARKDSLKISQEWRHYKKVEKLEKKKIKSFGISNLRLFNILNMLRIIYTISHIFILILIKKCV